MQKSAKIYIAGHRGMAGSAVWRILESQGYTNLIGQTSSELDLRDQNAVQNFFATYQPEAVINAAARVGGILANSNYPYEFLMENLLIQNNLIQAAHTNNVEKFVFLGSSCIYPKLAAQPLREEYLLTGPLEPTNEWYAIAKIAGVKACEAIRKQFDKDFVSLMPTNLYGPFDNFDLKTSHVLPAMIRKFHDAKLDGHSTVTLWGSGTPLREFLHVEDMARAVAYAVSNKLPEHLYNVGSGEEIAIKELAETVQKSVGHQGAIHWDATKPDGTPRKLMDSSKLRSVGWNPTVSLQEGLANTYQWFLEHQDSFKEVQIN